ncbi:MAG: hypothetical protein ABL964_09815 [Steroidobacteraceae bacterium]
MMLEDAILVAKACDAMPRYKLADAISVLYADYVKQGAELARYKRVPLFCRACGNRLIDGLCGRCGN